MMKKQFEWRELADNGLLEKVRKGTHYCGWDVEVGGPWETEEEAVAALDKFIADHETIFYSSSEFVLLTVYSNRNKGL